MDATIREIAARAGVSISTASRALNGHPDVSVCTRERVKDAAQALDYRANLHARALVVGSSQTLGLIIASTSAPFLNSLVTGILDCVAATSYGLMVHNTNEESQSEERAYRSLFEERVSGFLVTSIQSGSAPVQRLKERGIPFVLVNRRLDDLDTDWVIGDLRDGLMKLIAHLYGLGHRRFAAILDRPNRFPVKERVIGFKSALEAFNIPFDPKTIFYNDGKFESIYQQTVELLPTLNPRPTALFTYSDTYAIPVLQGLHDLGWRVPEDISVVGYDDMDFSRYLRPGLTTMAQPAYRIGQLGAELLLERLAFPKDQIWTPRHISLQSELIVRQSTSSVTDRG